MVCSGSDFIFFNYSTTDCSGNPVANSTVKASTAKCEKGAGGDYVKYQGCASSQADAESGGYVYSAAPRPLSSFNLLSVEALDVRAAPQPSSSPQSSSIAQARANVTSGIGCCLTPTHIPCPISTLNVPIQ
eukprot:749229-Hanusia_phi.AAC.2